MDATIPDRLAAYELPNEGVKGAELLLDLQEGPGVGNGGLDFQGIADDPRVAKECADFLCVITGDFGRIETAEEFAVAFAFLENGVPTETGLGALEDEEFEPAAVVVDGDAPFLVVVTDAEGISGPGAADEFFGGGHGREIPRLAGNEQFDLRTG